MKEKIFFKGKFTGLHKGTTLISIGLESESGATFYAEFTDYDRCGVDDWIRDNVMPKLRLDMGNNTFKIEPIFSEFKSIECKGDRAFVGKILRTWFEQFGNVEMWGDCLHYDWVLFADIFSNAFNIPENIYYIPFDICTLLRDNYLDPDVSRCAFAEGDFKLVHNALYDAHLIKGCYEKIMYIKRVARTKSFANSFTDPNIHSKHLNDEFLKEHKEILKSWLEPSNRVGDFSDEVYVKANTKNLADLNPLSIGCLKKQDR